MKIRCDLITEIMELRYFSQSIWYDMNNPVSKVHGANMGPTWFLSVPDGPHDGPMNLAIREEKLFYDITYGVYCRKYVTLFTVKIPESPNPSSVVKRAKQHAMNNVPTGVDTKTYMNYRHYFPVMSINHSASHEMARLWPLILADTLWHLASTKMRYPLKPLFKALPP